MLQGKRDLLFFKQLNLQEDKDPLTAPLHNVNG